MNYYIISDIAFKNCSHWPCWWNRRKSIAIRETGSGLISIPLQGFQRRYSKGYDPYYWHGIVDVDTQVISKILIIKTNLPFFILSGNTGLDDPEETSDKLEGEKISELGGVGKPLVESGIFDFFMAANTLWKSFIKFVTLN